MSRRILVTGGARGIGLEIGRRLAASGDTIVIADLDSAQAQATASRLPGTGHTGIAMDVCHEADIRAGFDAAEVDGPLTAVVCNAGILLFGPDGNRTPIIDMDINDWQRTHEVNLTGTFLTIREFLRRRKSNPVSNARIVTFTSSAAQLGGFRSSASYISSKSGVIGLTKATAREAAPMGITCNAVAPGLIDAPMLRLSLAPGDEPAAASNIPLGRIGQPQDVAAAVEYLISEDASYVTGSVIDVNGGYRMQ